MVSPTAALRSVLEGDRAAMRRLGACYAWSRVAAGAAMFLFPGKAFERLVGPDSSRPSVRFLARLVGARDAALGAGALAVLSAGGSARTWMAWGAAADAADAASVLVGYRHLRRGSRLVVLAMAVAGAATGGHLWSRLD